MANKETAAAVVAFLQNDLTNIAEDQRDSIEFALEAIRDAYQLSEDEVKAAPAITLASSAAPASAAAPAAASASAEDVAKAEALKQEGNLAIRSKDFQLAVDKYTEALKLVPENTIYLCNRAAAYTSMKDYTNAAKDSEFASQLDPSYAKAWSRLGLAKFALGDYKGSLEAYKAGLALEPENDTMKKGLEGAQAKVESDMMSSLGDLAGSSGASAGASGAGAAPGGFDFSNLASMFGGAGGAGGMGGLAEMMNNPQIMQAASEMMKNPNAIRDMMSNPQVQNMAKSMGLDTSSMDSMMNNPNLADMAKNFMGPGAGNDN